jgi:multiple sugar transport system permease protein
MDLDAPRWPPGRGLRAVVPPLQTRPTLGRWWRRRQTTLAPLLLLAPACLLFGVFVVYPIGASIRLSLYRWDGVGPKIWIGLGNYRELLADPVFYTALANNLRWLALFLIAPLLGLFLALLLNQTVTGIRLIRSLFFFPFVISQTAVGVIFAWFLNPHFGLLNQILGWLHLPPVAPLDSERWAIFAVALAGMWPQTAYCMILYLTGLTAIDPRLIEAARLDGAAGWRLLWHIVVPQLRPATFIVVMVCIVGALRSFDLVMIMTAGGPYNRSSVLAFYMYEQTFVGFRYGYGAAIATVLFLMMDGCIAFLLWRMLRRERIS